MADMSKNQGAPGTDYSNGIQQLAQTQASFEQVLQQPPNPPSYPQQNPPQYRPYVGMGSPVDANGYPTNHAVYASPAGHPGLPNPTNPTVMTSNINVTVPGNQIIIHEAKPDNTGAIIYSCVVLWLCCLPLGLAAFIIAMMAPNQPTYEDTAKQLRLANRLSGAGVAVGVVLVIVYIILRVIVISSSNSYE